jgi:peptidoglycan/xylan/chitin deacetylase (PgdA/CDA1 family)
MIISILIGNIWGVFAETNKISVVFRFDDPSALTDTDFEIRLLALFAAHHFPCTFAVVPFVGIGNLGDSASGMGTREIDSIKAQKFMPYLQAGILDIALHGYSHRSFRPLKNPVRSEFSGKLLSIQYDNILSGKKLLESLFKLKINTFVPPFNRYDNNTLKALDSAGIELLSAGSLSNAFKDSNLAFLPSTCEFSDLFQAINQARKCKLKNPVIVVLFHPFEFIEQDKRRGTLILDNVTSTLDWLSRQQDIRVYKLSQMPNIVRDLSSKHYKKYITLIHIREFLHPVLRPQKEIYYYPTDKELSTLIFQNAAIMLLSFGIILIVVSVCFYAVFRRLIRNQHLLWGLRIFLSICFLLIAAVSFNDYKIGYNKALVLCCVLGCMMPAFSIKLLRKS